MRRPLLWHRLGTRWRLTVWVLLIVFALTTVAGVIAIKLVERRFKDNIDEELRGVSQGLVALTEVLSDEELREISSSPEVQELTSTSGALIILDDDGVDLELAAGSRDDRVPPPDLGQYSLSELRGRAGEIFEVDGRDGAPDYRVIVSQLDDGRLLVAAIPLDGLRDTLETVGDVLAFVAIVGGIVMSVVVIFVAGYVTRPLNGMIATAEGIGSGALDQRIPTHGVDDVARLATALNAMLDRLEHAFADKAESEAKLRQFVADASHELRTPLAAILGYAQLVQTRMASTPEQVDDAVERISAEGERMRLLVEELLMLARLDHGRAPDTTPVDVGELVGVAVADAHAIAPDRDVAYRRGDGDLRVLADAVSLRQAVDNLIANTRVHTPPDSHVEVSVERDGSNVVITVDDDGPGINPADLDHVFDRFYRSERSRSRPGGAGLGLAIVLAVAASHDGSAHAARSPAGGARFTLTLPAIAATQPAAALAATSSPDPAG
jgi:two-component system, OmpR family, sensor kinase